MRSPSLLSTGRSFAFRVGPETTWTVAPTVIRAYLITAEIAEHAEDLKKFINPTQQSPRTLQ